MAGTDMGTAYAVPSVVCARTALAVPLSGKDKPWPSE